MIIAERTGSLFLPKSGSNPDYRRQVKIVTKSSVSQKIFLMRLSDLGAIPR